jgi:hypothetical protein
MPKRSIYFFALVLAIGFFVAQLHFCADLTSTPYGSHNCPFCTVASSALVTQAPDIAPVSVVNWLHSRAVVFNISSEAPRTTSPRAPPSL